MSECGSQGTFVPWLFQWNTVDKNPGIGLFANPKYSVISAPYSGIRNLSNLESNDCYYPNNQGGIDTDECSDSQKMTWFGYATTNVPTNIPQLTATTTPCNMLYKNLNSSSHACQSIPGGYSIRGLYNQTTGRLLGSGKGFASVNALSIQRNMNLNWSFTIIPHSKPHKQVNIAEFCVNSYCDPFFTLGLSATSTNLEIKTTKETKVGQPRLNVTYTTTISLPLGVSTKVTLQILKPQLEIYYNDTLKATTINRVGVFYYSSQSFSSPPM